MSQSIPLDNMYSCLSNLCSDCDVNACLCEANCPDENIFVTENNTSNSSVLLNSILLHTDKGSSQISMSQKDFSRTESNHMSEELTLNSSDDLVVRCTSSMRPSHITDMHDSFISNDFSGDNSGERPNSSANFHANSDEQSINIRSFQNSNDNSSYETENDQPDLNNALDLGLRGKGLRIGHINIQGLSNKIDQLKLLLQSEKNLIHIFGVSETKLNNIHPDLPFHINGFQKPFRRDRKENAGGGILVYVKDGVCCKQRSDLEHVGLECIWLEVQPVHSKSFFVGQLYRPPNSTIQWNEIFEESLENVLKEEKEIYLLGDFNRDLLNNQINRAWTDYIEPFGITQLVSEATRVTPDSSTLIDHVYSTCPENVNNVDVPKIGLSDHFPIFFTRKMHVHQPKGNHCTISYRSFKDFDETKFINDLQSVPWNIIKLFENTDDILESWTDLFLEVVNKNIPIKQHRVKHKNQPQWITPEILDAIRSRDRHKSLGNNNEYKFWRRKVTKLIRNAKRDKYQTFIENNK
ncbi:MAG: endonuclease/exonuclease/phosphatase family protein, partial [Candidatus Thiodiazotropha sp.]